MKGLKQVLRTITASWKRVVATVAIGGTVWLLFVLFYFPQYSYQMVANDIFLLDNAFLSLFWYQYASSGILGVALPALIAGLVGITAVATGVSLLQQTRIHQSITGGIGATVGFLSAGCASCSVGVLALLGFVGGVALLPFNGKGLQAASILLLLGALEYTGRNNTCEVTV